MVYKTVALRQETYEKLQQLGSASDTMDSVVTKLIDKCGDDIK